MEIRYDKESTYGEEIRFLASVVNQLQDEGITYTSIEVHDILSTIAAEALRIRCQVDRSARAYDAAHELHHTA